MASVHRIDQGAPRMRGLGSEEHVTRLKKDLREAERALQRAKIREAVERLKRAVSAGDFGVMMRIDAGAIIHALNQLDAINPPWAR